jgi:thiol-disulfide isomerase/thioredoxin
MRNLFLYLLFAASLSAQQATAAANKAPDINLPAASGMVQLDDLSGKVIYLDFWASWCQPCKQSFPWMNQMKQSYADQGFEVLAVNLDKDRELADQFLSKMDVNFIVAFDEDGQSASDYKLKGMPSSFLIDRDGSIHAAHIGFRDEDKKQLEQAIIDLLNARPER